MSAVDFLDTNVLLYAYDGSNPRNQQVARGLLRQAVAGGAAISTQVPAEFASVLLHKMKPAAAPAQVRIALDALQPIRTVMHDGPLIRRSVEVHARYGVRFYDAMIVAAAEKAACGRI